MDLGASDRRFLVRCLELSREPGYDSRLGLPLHTISASFFPAHGGSEAAVERLNGLGLLDYVTPGGIHGRLSTKGATLATVFGVEAGFHHGAGHAADTLPLFRRFKIALAIFGSGFALSCATAAIFGMGPCGTGSEAADMFLFGGYLLTVTGVVIMGVSVVATVGASLASRLR